MFFPRTAPGDATFSEAKTDPAIADDVFVFGRLSL